MKKCIIHNLLKRCACVYFFLSCPTEYFGIFCKFFNRSLQVKSGKVRPSNHNQTGWTEQVIRMDKQARKEVLASQKSPPDGDAGSKKTLPLSQTAQSIKLPDFEGTPKEKYDQLQNWLRQFVQTKPKPPEYANIANFYKIIPFNVSFWR